MDNTKKIRACAPLRLSLAGGGTDMASYFNVYNGAVLNTTIGLYAFCTISARNHLYFEAQDVQQSLQTQLTESLSYDGKLNLHKAVYNRIVKDYHGGNPIGHELITYCDVPPGTGLGSSSTLVVAMIKAYSEFLNLEIDDYKIAELAYQIERIDLQMAGGKQDQYAGAFGGFNFMEFYKDRTIINPLRIKSWIKSELERSVILYNTGRSRYSSDIIAQQNQQVLQKSDTTLQAMHLMRDEAFVMKEHLLKGRFDSVAKSFLQGWQVKKQASSLTSNPELDSLYNTIIAAGALAGKISGAGGGGFFMFLVPPEKRMNIIQILKAQGTGIIYPCCFVDEGVRSWRIRS